MVQYNKKHVERVSLTDSEWNALLRISGHSHMDEWFCLCEDHDGVFVIDLDNGSELDFREAVNMLADGIVEPTWNAAGAENRSSFIGLCTRFGIEFHPDPAG